MLLRHWMPSPMGSNPTYYCILAIFWLSASVRCQENIVLRSKEPVEAEAYRIELQPAATPEAETAPAIVLSTQDPTLFLEYYTENEYENCTNCQIPAGIYFRVSQKGVDYITGLAAEALPQLFEKSSLPAINTDEIKITKFTIEKFQQPVIKAKFLAGTGVEAHVFLPQVMLSAVYDASTFFTTVKGKLKADVQNLSVVMEVHVSRNQTAKVNIVETPVCNVSSGQVRIVFAGDLSAGLNLLRTIIQDQVNKVLGEELCKIPRTLTDFFEHQKRAILMTTPAPPPTTPTTPALITLKYGTGYGYFSEPTTTKEPEENENAFYETSEEEPDEDLAAKFASDLCANERIDEDVVSDVDIITTARPQRTSTARQSPEEQHFNPKLAEGQWAPDLTLMYPANFSSEGVLFGLDGGMVFFGQKARHVPRPRRIDLSTLSDKMFGVMISDYVPNTFLTHVYENGFGTIHEVFKAGSLPKFIKPIAKVLCSNCELQLVANLTKKPTMTIGATGVNMEIEGDVSIKFVGRWKTYNLVQAITLLDVVVKPYVRHSRVYGDVGLTKVDIKMKNMGLRGLFANSLTKAINAVVPRKLWPKIKKRLRFALSQRGIRLPVMCGVELERPSLSYTNHAIVINTDFSYDLPRFVNKFKAYMDAEVTKAKKKQQADSEEEYETRFLRR